MRDGKMQRKSADARRADYWRNTALLMWLDGQNSGSGQNQGSNQGNNGGCPKGCIPLTLGIIGGLILGWFLFSPALG